MRSHFASNLKLSYSACGIDGDKLSIIGAWSDHIIGRFDKIAFGYTWSNNDSQEHDLISAKWHPQLSFHYAK